MSEDEFNAKPVRIRGIKILGAKRTRVRTIESELESAYDATTFGEVAKSISAAVKTFESFGIFKKMHIHVGATDQAGVADLIVQVEEAGVQKLSVQLSQDGKDSAADLQGTFLNPLGFAESVKIEAIVGKSGSQNFQAALRVPHFLGLKSTTIIEAFQSAVHLTDTSGCTARSQGINLKYQPDGSAHSFVFEIAKRDLIPSLARPHGTFANVSSEMLRQVMDPSLKSSLKHCFKWSKHTSHPRELKATVKATNELAGAGGDVCFWKSLVELSVSKILTAPYWGSAGLECRAKVAGGFLYPMGIDGGRKHPSSVGTHFHDRFFLGGTSGVAPLLGFEDRRVGGQVGQRDQAQLREEVAKAAEAGPSWFGTKRARPSQFFDAMGGDVILAASTSLRSPLPVKFLQDLGVKATAHLSAGNLSTLSSWPGFGAFLEAARVSTGIGLAIPTPIGEVSVTYSAGISGVASTDSTQRYQVGFGFDLSNL